MSGISNKSDCGTSNAAVNVLASRLGFREFIALMALLMSLSALSIDIMLIALPEIDREFFLAVDNDRQLMVTVYMVGFALGQPFFGPLSDCYDRKPMLFLVLTASFLCWACACLISMHWQWSRLATWRGWVLP